MINTYHLVLVGGQVAEAVGVGQGVLQLPLQLL